MFKKPASLVWRADGAVLGRKPLLIGASSWSPPQPARRQQKERERESCYFASFWFLGPKVFSLFPRPAGANDATVRKHMLRRRTDGRPDDRSHHNNLRGLWPKCFEAWKRRNVSLARKVSRIRIVVCVWKEVSGHFPRFGRTSPADRNLVTAAALLLRRKARPIAYT